jgi:hypothetical protein
MPARVSLVPPVTIPAGTAAGRESRNSPGWVRNPPLTSPGMAEFEALTQVRERATALQARIDSPTDNPKADALARGAVHAAARHAVLEGESKDAVADAAGVDVSEVEGWLR